MAKANCKPTIAKLPPVAAIARKRQALARAAFVSNEDTSDEDFETLSTDPPMFSDEQMYALEAKYAEERGVTRRVLLAAGTRSVEELSAACVADPEAFMDAFECGVEYLQREKQFMEELLTPVARRLMFCLCEVDWTAAEAPFDQDRFLEACSGLNPANWEFGNEIVPE